MISVETVIYVPARESGSEAPKTLTIDPLPVVEGDGEGCIGMCGRVVKVADLRLALDRAERIQKEDAR